MNSDEVDPNSTNTAENDCIPLFTSASSVGRPVTAVARHCTGLFLHIFTKCYSLFTASPGRENLRYPYVSATRSDELAAAWLLGQ